MRNRCEPHRVSEWLTRRTRRHYYAILKDKTFQIFKWKCKHELWWVGLYLQKMNAQSRTMQGSVALYSFNQLETSDMVIFFKMRGYFTFLFNLHLL